MDETTPEPTELETYMEMVTRHQAALRAFVARIAPRRDQADDIAQEVFLVAFGKWEAYDPQREPLPWLRGIARNIVRSAWRQQRERTDPGVLHGVLEQAAHRAFSDDEGSPRRLDALQICLEELPAPDRQAIRMRHAEGQPIAEIATRIDRTISAVHSYLLRIRRRLRDCVGRRLGEVGA